LRVSLENADIQAANVDQELSVTNVICTFVFRKQWLSQVGWLVEVHKAW
jgi:hypothetical protein